ncbi:MAG: calcium-translocating P-type ATPase, PMCA-type [Clostridia bacterium]|nr:calcium-translocating P-type ATPase, PMCA-type [Clostridia bacterium]
MKPYFLESAEVLKELNSSADGLSSSEIQGRSEKWGKNKLAEGKKETIFQRFIKELMNPMILVLLAAAVISAVTVVLEKHLDPTSTESFADSIIILVVVLLNAILGVIQESKAEQAIEALKTMTAATTRVLRDGKIESVKSEDLVPGDVILLEAGDSVPADCRILESASLKIEEAALTGESVPVEKIDSPLSSESDNVPLGDRKNMCYMGSTVVYGRGKAVVASIGMDTEMGKIAGALTQAQNEETPLQRRLADLSKILTWLVLGISVLIFAVEILRAFIGGASPAFTDYLEAFMVAVSLAVAAIPEGLAAVVTIVLSIGVTKMSKRKAVIRRLTAVETLGCAQVICSDKTGTLTQNKMTVVRSWTTDELLLAKGMALASGAEYDREKETAIGEPTECALVNFAFLKGQDKNDLKNAYPRVAEVPFDSGRKMMTTVHEHESGLIQFTKGAPDELLRRCTGFLSEDGVHPLTDEKRAEILAENKNMADQALRVLACAYRDLDTKPEKEDSVTLEKELVFLGLCGMIDPVRPEVKAAVEACKSASIRVVMITGDHIDTAVAIGKELGILESEAQAVRGSDLDSMSDDELDVAIERFSVYARVQPEHKVRIVSAWKRRGIVTAMTGDGVNDAPSIKTADIGVGMGITGTDVTKNVADMILADDNFATIVSAVEEGRKIYANIRKAIQFLLSSNLSEVIAVFCATMMGFVILEPVHLLWINLITDSLPALALGMEHGEADSMKQKPRDSKEGIFSGGVGFDIFYQGALVAILTLVAYFIGVNTFNSPEHGTTMAFLTLSMAEIFQSFNLRSRRGSIFSMKKQNKWLWLAGAVALLLTTVVIEVPFIAALFEFQPITWTEYAIGLGLSITVIPIVEIVKLIQRTLARKKNS